MISLWFRCPRISISVPVPVGLINLSGMKSAIVSKILEKGCVFRGFQGRFCIMKWEKMNLFKVSQSLKIFNFTVRFVRYRRIIQKKFIEGRLFPTL